MKDLFRKYDVKKYTVTKTEKEHGLLFDSEIKSIIEDDYEMAACEKELEIECKSFFLLDVTDIQDDYREFTEMYETYETEKYRVQLVGEYSDGMINDNDNDKECYLIYRVEDK